MTRDCNGCRVQGRLETAPFPFYDWVCLRQPSRSKTFVYTKLKYKIWRVTKTEHELVPFLIPVISYLKTRWGYKKTNISIHNLCDEKITKSREFVIVKENDISFSCVCPVIVNQFHHNVVKVVCSSHLHQNFLLIFASCNLAVLGISFTQLFQIGHHVVQLCMQMLQFFSLLLKTGMVSNQVTKRLKFCVYNFYSLLFRQSTDHIPKHVPYQILLFWQRSL